MSKDVDLSQPLSDEDIAELKQRHTLEYVDRLVALSAGADFDGGGSSEDDKSDDLTPAQKAAATRAAKKAEKEAAAAAAAAAGPDETVEVELVTYEVALKDGDPVRVSIPADTDEDEIADAVKAAAIEGGAEEDNLEGFTKVEDDQAE